MLVGLDPLTEDEYRGFLHFPLTGVGGVPGDAVIVSASLDIVINTIVIQPPANTIPIRIDLVSFQPATLSGPEFFLDSPLALASVTFPIFRADVGNSITVDVSNPKSVELLPTSISRHWMIGNTNSGIMFHVHERHEN